MAFDGAFLYRTIEELKAGIDCHIDKIYQPSKDELVFLLRKKGFAKRLLITARSGCSRIHFTENKYENPPVPPMFCMLIRKYLSSARLIDIRQPHLERLAELIFSSTNEMGDRVEIKLICELIGNQANIILVNENGKIIDSLRHSDIETSSRFILPGALYEYPPSQHKINPLKTPLSEIVSEISSQSDNLSKALLSVLDGFSPLVCREIENSVTVRAAMGENLSEALKNALESIIRGITVSPVPTLILNEDGSPLDFSYTDILQYGEKQPKQYFAGCCELLDAYYSSKDLDARIKNEARDITKLITNLKSRTEKKLALRLTELEKCKDRENLRIFGELLKANLYAIESGASFAVVPNYYDENMADIKIPLNPALSPAKNAEKYFKEYKKSYAAEQALSGLTETDKTEIKYFDSVLDSISRCKTVSEIGEIRQELSVGGYIKRQNTNQKSKTEREPKFREFLSDEGYKILVGKNNIQNDYITTKLASKKDLWFHVKNIPGSHVVIVSGGNPINDETVTMAATIAATNSKASASTNVPVDYTEIKNVKKPNGAKPGMVIYTTNRTAFVTPDKKYLI